MLSSRSKSHFVEAFVEVLAYPSCSWDVPHVPQMHPDMVHTSRKFSAMFDTAKQLFFVVPTSAKFILVLLLPLLCILPIISTRQKPHVWSVAMFDTPSFCWLKPTAFIQFPYLHKAMNYCYIHTMTIAVGYKMLWTFMNYIPMMLCLISIC